MKSVTVATYLNYDVNKNAWQVTITTITANPYMLALSAAPAFSDTLRIVSPAPTALSLSACTNGAANCFQTLSFLVSSCAAISNLVVNLAYTGTCQVMSSSFYNAASKLTQDSPVLVPLARLPVTLRPSLLTLANHALLPPLLVSPRTPA